MLGIIQVRQGFYTKMVVCGVMAFGVAIAGFPSAKGAKARRVVCSAEMALVQGRFCIDRVEASVVEILPKGKTRAHSPFKSVDGLKVKAVAKVGVKPQAYISRDQAEEACKNAGKRLCSDEEWVTACRGKKPTQYPYGDQHRERSCNDQGFSSFNHYYGQENGEPSKEAYSWQNMNDPRLNQMKGTLSLTGAFKKCRNAYGVFDMVGNLHEWTSAKEGTFRGGYYLDTKINGEGCEYRTTAHAPDYHDYSTGFRCCK